MKKTILPPTHINRAVPIPWHSKLTFFTNLFSLDRFRKEFLISPMSRYCVELWNNFSVCRNRKFRINSNEFKLYGSSSSSIRLQQTFKDDDGAIFFHYHRFVFCSLRTTVVCSECRRHHFSFNVHFSPLFFSLARSILHVTVAHCKWQTFVSISMIHLYRSGWL